MSVNALNPYLSFNGNAEKAIRLYESALGAKVEQLMRWGDVEGMKVAPEHRSRVMHAALRIGGGLVMLADAPPDQPVEAGSNVEVCLQLDDVEDLRRRFDALATGGKVRMAPHDTFWGATFGMLVDAVGVRWMFNCQKQQG